MARNNAEYRAHLRRAMRQERQPQITLPDLLVAIATLALIGAITTGDSPLKIVVRYRLLTLLT